MNKEEILKLIDERYTGSSKEILSNQIELFYNLKDRKIEKNNFKMGDIVKLPKGTLMHGTYKNIEGLRDIVKNGLIASDIIGVDRKSKYPACTGVWNLKKDYYLKDYVNFYSGGTVYIKNNDGSKIKTKVIPFDEMNNMMDEFINDKNCFRWFAEQTKEARFLPSLVQDKVQIGIIFNGQNECAKSLLKRDILDCNNISDEDVKPFVNEIYYERFISERKNKDEFFTDRESAILYGIPSNLIEGILVGRKYEKDFKILEEIKSILPYAYICNLDGIVIK